MAVVTSDFLVAVNTNFRAYFEDQFLAAKSAQKRQLFATEVPSDTLIESYNWLGTVPAMTEWLDERRLAGLTAHNYSITNRDWANGIEVDRNTFKDNKLGLIMPRIQQLSLEAVRFEDQLTIEGFVNGTTELCYDGQFFFDTDHKDPGAEYQTNQSNLLTGTGVGVAALLADYDAARVAMRRFRDGAGRPMNIMATHVLAPPELEGSFNRILNTEHYPVVFGSNTAAASAGNPWKGTTKLETSAYLTDANDWYLLALAEPVKPLIFQMRQQPEFAALDNPRDEEVFMRKKFRYGADARYAVGYGLWQIAIKVSNS